MKIDYSKFYVDSNEKFSQNEEIFINHFLKLLNQNEFYQQFSINRLNEFYQQFSINRLSDGTLNFIHPVAGQVGRVKLNGKIYKMQILKHSKNIKDNDPVIWLNGNLNEFLEYLNLWIDFIIKSQKRRLKTSKLY